MSYLFLEWYGITDALLYVTATQKVNEKSWRCSDEGQWAMEMIEIMFELSESEVIVGQVLVSEPIKTFKGRTCATDSIGCIMSGRP